MQQLTIINAKTLGLLTYLGVLNDHLRNTFFTINPLHAHHQDYTDRHQTAFFLGMIKALDRLVIYNVYITFQPFNNVALKEICRLT